MKIFDPVDRSNLRKKGARAVEYRTRPGFTFAEIDADSGGPLRLTYKPIVAWRPQYQEDGGIAAQTEDGRWCHPEIVRCPNGDLIKFDPKVEISADTDFPVITEAEALRHLLAITKQSKRLDHEK